MNVMCRTCFACSIVVKRKLIIDEFEALLNLSSR